MTRHFYAIFRPYAGCDSEGDLVLTFPDARTRDEYCSRKGWAHYEAISAAGVRQLFRPLDPMARAWHDRDDRHHCEAIAYTAAPTHCRK